MKLYNYTWFKGLGWRSAAEGLYNMHKDLDPVPSTQEWKGGRDLNFTLYIFSTMIRMGKLNMLMVFKLTTIKKKKRCGLQGMNLAKQRNNDLISLIVHINKVLSIRWGKNSFETEIFAYL